jgi:hypothetical protein
MELTKLRPLLPQKKDAKVINAISSEASSDINGQRNFIPNEIFEFTYAIDGIDRKLNLRKMFEIDVTELSELTLDNLCIQLEQISSIRLTLGRAYEQTMEDYGKFMINYDIWYAGALEDSRARYWNKQSGLQKQYDLAKSGLKPPTQDDLKNELLLGMESKVRYEEYQGIIIRYQRLKSLLSKVDEILIGREFALKTILDKRSSRVESGRKNGLVTPSV